MIRAAAATLVLAGLLTPLGGKAHRKTEEGNRRFEEGAYEDALRAYTQAQVAAPEAAELHYDIGNVLYRQGDYTGAAEAFTRALVSSPPSLAPHAAYNLGNALFREERFDEAAKAYRKTLQMTPDDVDAKRNLELALRALEERSEPPPSQQESSEGEDQQGEGERPTDPESGDRSEEGPEPQDRQEGRPMSVEEAESLLDRLAEAEKEHLRREAERQVPASDRTREKDW